MNADFYSFGAEFAFIGGHSGYFFDDFADMVFTTSG
jgi:hypothetical protein